jgi:hypothetical protein
VQVCKQSNFVSRGLIISKGHCICYNSQIVVHVYGQDPPIITWHICQIIVDCLSPVVINYVSKLVQRLLVV